MLYMTDENGNLIPIATDNQGNESGKWVDGANTVITNTSTTTLTNIDISSFISNYDENGEYELLISILFSKSSTNGQIYIGSDIITTYTIGQQTTYIDMLRPSIIIPIKKYLKFYSSISNPNYFSINLNGYRRVK